jgi:hypothetical protein
MAMLRGASYGFWTSRLRFADGHLISNWMIKNDNEVWWSDAQELGWTASGRQAVSSPVSNVTFSIHLTQDG